ncbi:LytTR family DNA-binding domain-containing protein [Microaerobacter geothermalis]|nr:LytTR family DNA-binding domain-containing protein [Microaerobacter geothermalis]
MDDEKPARDELKFLLDQYPEVKICGEAENGLDAFQLIEMVNPDVVFLDIEMYEMNGIQLAKLLKKRNKPLPLIVFSTAFTDYAVDAFDLKAVDYILKPYQEERVAETVQRLTEKMNQCMQKRILKKIVVEQKGKLIPIEPTDIIFIKAEERKTIILTKSGEFYTKLCLQELEDAQLPIQLYRTHRSYLVNIDQIAQLIPWFNYTMRLKMKHCDLEIPVSRNRVKELKGLLGC